MSKKLKNWVETYRRILIGDSSVSCPECGSSNVRCGHVLIDPSSKMGYGAVWCDDCRNGMHLSRVNLVGVSNIMKQLPDDLNFM